MARFDVYRFASKSVPLVVDVQSTVLKDLKSCVVIPLVPVDHAEKEELPRLKPRLTVQGKDYILVTTDIAALPRARLGAFIANIDSDYRDDITNALDLLFVGF